MEHDNQNSIQRQVLRASFASIAGNAVLSVAKLVVGFIRAQMMLSAIELLFSDEPRPMPGIIAIYVTVASIVCKLLLSFYQTSVGRKTGSSMLIANGINMRNDVIISLSVLVGLFFSFVLHLPILDCVTALLVSCYIIRSSFKIFMESNIELMDGVKDTSVYQKIFDAIDGVDGISNPHRVRSRSIGGKYMITLDVEADGNMTLSQAHTLANEIEQNIRQRIPEVYDIVVHIEPFGTHPENVFGVKETTSTKNLHK